MKYRRFGRTGLQVSDIGYGMYGATAPEWSGTDVASTRLSLQLAVDLGCTFFDTAWGYGEGRGERLLGELLRANPDRRLIAATKIPPKNLQWPTRRGDPIGAAFPPDHIRECAERSLRNLDVRRLDLLQFHVWEDDWAEDEGWQRAVDDLRREGLVSAIGLSLNRWEPWNALKTIRTGLIDSVQVIFNIFDQAPEDELFPLCRKLGIAIIARVPFDEGGLTGSLTATTSWPSGDWRNVYFGPENLRPTVDRADALKEILPSGIAMPDLALQFILANQDVSVVIPGMRTSGHVRTNFANSDRPPMSTQLVAELRAHRWDRQPTTWSLSMTTSQASASSDASHVVSLLVDRSA
jgi:aryl-alcohol dehydrogenase-like predicted oxidoreductase